MPAGENTVYWEIPDNVQEDTNTKENKIDASKVYINTSLDLPSGNGNYQCSAKNGDKSKSNIAQQEKEYELPLIRDPIEPSVYTSIQNEHGDRRTTDVTQQDKEYELPLIPDTVQSSVYTSIQNDGAHDKITVKTTRN